MADRVSPLAPAADRLAALGPRTGGAVALVEEPFLRQLDVRLDPSSAAAGRLGVPLPVEPNSTARDGELEVLWLGPDEWLVLAPPDADLEDRLRAAGATVTDVSAQRTTLWLTGARARDLLAKGCALDLHPRVFGAGRCAQTMLARSQVVLAADSDGGFRVLVRSSFALYLAEWLLDAAVEYLE